MRLRLLLPFLLALSIAACGDEPTTIIAGDDTTDAAEDAMEDSAVADDSAPFLTTTTGPESLELSLDESPRATVAWDETLEEYPLLTHMSNPRGSGVGSASFVQVDIDGNFVASGSEEHPHFMITIDSWFGTNNYIEFTMSMTNVQLVDGQPASVQCANNISWLSQTEDGRFLWQEDQLPKTRGAQLEQEAWGCDEGLPPISGSSLFDEEVGIKVTETGLVMNSLTSRPSWFMRLDEPTAQNPTVTTLVDIPETTVPETTTTTTD